MTAVSKRPVVQGSGFGEADEDVPRQIGNAFRRAVSGQIVGRSNKLQTTVKQVSGAQRRIVQAACADGNIHAPFDEVDIAFGRGELQRHLRITLTKRAHERGNAMQQRGRGGIHPKNALRCTARGEEFCFCGIDVVQYLPSAPEETAAFFGKPKLACGAVEQIGGKFLFQPFHGAADDGVGQAQTFCRTAETAAFHHLHEYGQLIGMALHCC